MKHGTFGMILVGLGSLAAIAGAEPVRFDGLIAMPSNADPFTWTPVNITLPFAQQNPTMLQGDGVFVIMRSYGGGTRYVDLAAGNLSTGSGIHTAESNSMLLVGALDAGSIIDSSIQWRSSTGLNSSVWMAIGPNSGDDGPDNAILGIGETGYAGVYFTLGSGVHYGWIELYRRSDWAYNITAWGYETQAGVGIAAGAVPTPGVLALLGCAAAAGVRRRR